MRTGEPSEIVQQGEYQVGGPPMFIPASLSFASISTLLVFGPGARDALEGSARNGEKRCTDCADDRGLEGIHFFG